MKLCLIFTPLSSLSVVPLGISYLKSFIRKNTNGVQVKNLDLSNAFYHSLGDVDFLRHLSNLCQICPKNNENNCNRVLKKLKAKEIDCHKIAFVVQGMISRFESKEFYDAKKYNSGLKVYDLVFHQIYGCIDYILKLSLEAPKEENDSVLKEHLFYRDIKRIYSLKPDILGFSVFSKHQLNYSLNLAGTLKKMVNFKIIFGGAYTSHLDGKAMLEIFDFIDFIIYKEGELGIVKLLKKLKTKELSTVPNLLYRKSSRIVKNKESVILDLDQIPFPDFSDYNLKKYFTPAPVISTLFSRGCAWGACTYCALNKTFSRPYRTRSVANLVRELKYYKKSGIKYVCFADEMILANDLDHICRSIIKQKIKMSFLTMARPTKDFTQEIFGRIYKAGFRKLSWGVESFSQRILNLMNKGIKLQEILDVLKKASAAGLKNTVFLIHKFPLQAEKDILEDIKYLKKNSKYITRVAIHDFWLEEGTPIFYHFKKFGLKSLKRTLLLKTKRGNLYSPTVEMVHCKRLDYKRIIEENGKQLERMFNPSSYKYGAGYTLEHELLQQSINKNRAKAKSKNS